MPIFGVFLGSHQSLSCLYCLAMQFLSSWSVACVCRSSFEGRGGTTRDCVFLKWMFCLKVRVESDWTLSLPAQQRAISEFCHILRLYLFSIRILSLCLFSTANHLRPAYCHLYFLGALSLSGEIGLVVGSIPTLQVHTIVSCLSFGRCHWSKIDSAISVNLISPSLSSSLFPVWFLDRSMLLKT